MFINYEPCNVSHDPIKIKNGGSTEYYRYSVLMHTVFDKNNLTPEI